MVTNTDFVSSYFDEEKISASIMIILGSIYVLSGLFFLFIIKYSFFKGIAIPLLFIGCMQCGAGSAIVMRTSKDISRVEYQLVHETQKIKSEELPRMEKVLDNFTLYKYIELVFIVIGLLLILLFFNSAQTFWKGLGIGLLLPALIFFILDFVAQKRAEQYVNFLLQAL